MGQVMARWEERLREVLGQQGEQILPPGDAQNAIKAAIRRHSRSIGRITHADFPGNGSSFDLSVSSMTGWTNGFSEVVAVEMPQGEREPVYLDEQEVSLYPSNSDPTAVRLAVSTPGTGQTARVYYTVPWPIPDTSAATDRLPDTDFDAVVHLAGSIAAQELASRAAGHQRPTIPSASAAGSETEEQRWSRRSQELLEVYLEHFGLDEESMLPAEAIIDWDVRAQWIETGHHFLFRGRR